MTHPDIPASRDEIDQHVSVVVLEQVAYFQALHLEPVEAMTALLDSKGGFMFLKNRGPLSPLLWADVADLVEDIYRGDQGLPRKRVYQYSTPRYKNGVPI